MATTTKYFIRFSPMGSTNFDSMRGQIGGWAAPAWGKACGSREKTWGTVLTQGRAVGVAVPNDSAETSAARPTGVGGFTLLHQSSSQDLFSCGEMVHDHTSEEWKVLGNTSLPSNKDILVYLFKYATVFSIRTAIISLGTLSSQFGMSTT